MAETVYRKDREAYVNELKAAASSLFRMAEQIVPEDVNNVTGIDVSIDSACADVAVMSVTVNMFPRIGHAEYMFHFSDDGEE